MYYLGCRRRPYVVFGNYVNVWLPVHGLVYIYIYIYIIQSSTTQCKLQIYTRMQVTPKIITLRYII